MTTSRKVTGDLKHYQAKSCFQGKCLHGPSFFILTPKFVFELYLTCDVQNITYLEYRTPAEK